VAGAETHRVRLGYGWKMVLTGGPHPSVTQGRGTRLSVEEERGRVAGRGEEKLGRGSCARWAEGKDWGRGFGPSGQFSRERELSK